MAGLWCVNIGYGRAELADVAAEQMRQLSYFISGVGVAMPPDEYLPEVESLCRKYGILLHHQGASGRREGHCRRRFLSRQRRARWSRRRALIRQHNHSVAAFGHNPRRR
jgi:hypothetical protein